MISLSPLLHYLFGLLGVLLLGLHILDPMILKQLNTNSTTSISPNISLHIISSTFPILWLWKLISPDSPWWWVHSVRVTCNLHEVGHISSWNYPTPLNANGIGHLIVDSVIWRYSIQNFHSPIELLCNAISHTLMPSPSTMWIFIDCPISTDQFVLLIDEPLSRTIKYIFCSTSISI